MRVSETGLAWRYVVFGLVGHCYRIPAWHRPSGHRQCAWMTGIAPLTTPPPPPLVPNKGADRMRPRGGGQDFNVRDRGGWRSWSPGRAVHRPTHADWRPWCTFHRFLRVHRHLLLGGALRASLAVLGTALPRGGGGSSSSGAVGPADTYPLSRGDVRRPSSARVSTFSLPLIPVWEGTWSHCTSDPTFSRMSRTCVHRSTCRAGPDVVCQLWRCHFCALPSTPSTTYWSQGRSGTVFLVCGLAGPPGSRAIHLYYWFAPQP